MPLLVDELGVAADGIHLGTGLLELLVVVCEVLELGRADEREVSGVEEEQAPFAEHVLLGDGLDLAVAVGLDREVLDFFSDERHVCLLTFSGLKYSVTGTNTIIGIMV